MKNIEVVIILFICSLSRQQIESCPDDDESNSILSKLAGNLILNISLPNYSYCGPGTPILHYLKNWESHKPINELDLACFYHDMAYSNYSATPAFIKEADIELIKSCKRIYNDIKWDKDPIQKLEAKALADGFEIKIKMQNAKLIDSLAYKTKKCKESREIFELVEQYGLPQTWNLSFFFPRANS